MLWDEFFHKTTQRRIKEEAVPTSEVKLSHGRKVWWRHCLIFCTSSPDGSLNLGWSKLKYSVDTFCSSPAPRCLSLSHQVSWATNRLRQPSHLSWSSLWALLASPREVSSLSGCHRQRSVDCHCSSGPPRVCHAAELLLGDNQRFRALFQSFYRRNSGLRLTKCRNCDFTPLIAL